MENETIFLKKLAFPKEEEVHLLNNIVNDYSHLFRLSPNYNTVRLIKEDINKYYNSYNENYAEYFNTVNNLLYSYWRVIKANNALTENPVMYIFPYKFNNVNGCLSTLCSDINPYGNTTNGLREAYFMIMDDKLFTENDLLFEKATKEEMLENAKKSCEDAIEERLWKLKNVYNVELN